MGLSFCSTQYAASCILSATAWMSAGNPQQQWGWKTSFAALSSSRCTSFPLMKPWSCPSLVFHATFLSTETGFIKNHAHPCVRYVKWHAVIETTILLTKQQTVLFNSIQTVLYYYACYSIGRLTKSGVLWLGYLGTLPNFSQHHCKKKKDSELYHLVEMQLWYNLNVLYTELMI